MIHQHETSCPFLILVDTGEQLPYHFTGLRSDADRGGRSLKVLTERRYLGESMGDYSIDGLEGVVHVERKSLDDAHGTFLGWGDRRRRFENELERLSAMRFKAIVVETSIGELIKTVEQYGVKTKEENQKSIFRQVLAWQQDFGVPWVFADTRRLAEIATFRILERAFNKTRKERKESSSERAGRDQQQFIF